MADYNSPANLVFGNSLLLNKIIARLSQRDLAQLCLVHKQAWLCAVPHLWRNPKLYRHTTELFSRSVGAALPYSLRDYRCYGELVGELDVCTRGRKRDEVSDSLIMPLFRHCSRLHHLNLSECRSVPGRRINSLFRSNLVLCSSLVSVDMSNVNAFGSRAVCIPQYLRGVRKLLLNYTNANDATMIAISQLMPMLEWLEIDGCYVVTDVGIKAVVDCCPCLTYLCARRCRRILNQDVFEQVNARGGQGNENDYTDHDYDYFDMFGGFD